MSGPHTALLFANEAFYSAFAARDSAAMRKLWAKDAPVACIHPGWPPLFGREAVLDSWARIMENPASPAVEISGAKAITHGDTGIVFCYEKIEDTYLIATNTFVREGRHWKLVHHQAGPVATPPPGAASNDEEAEGGPDDDDDDSGSPSNAVH